MCKSLGPVQVRYSKYSLLLLLKWMHAKLRGQPGYNRLVKWMHAKLRGCLDYSRLVKWMRSCVVIWITAGWSNECKVVWSSGLQQAGKIECIVMWSSGLQQAGKTECKVMWSYGLQQAGKTNADVLCAPSHSCWWCPVAVVSVCVHVGCKFWVYSLERTCLDDWLFLLLKMAC